MKIPLEAINRTNEHHADMVFIGDWVTDKPEIRELDKQADIIIVQRIIMAEICNKIIKMRLGHGKTIAADLDDAYQIMPKSLAAYDFWNKGLVMDESGHPTRMGVSASKQLAWGLKHVDAIISPSRIILDDWREINPKGYHVPNYLPVERYEPYRNYDLRKSLIIGWGGSRSHLESWMHSGVISAIKRILSERRDVKLLIAGGDQRIVAAMNLPGFLQTSVEIVQWVPPELWPQILNSFSIGLIPLAGAYDERRSWIKPLEYGIMGIPWIGTRNCWIEQHESQGILVRNKPTDWYEAIKKTLDNLPQAQEQAQANIAWAKEQDINKNVEKIIATYQNIIHDTMM